ncbi:GtrA family protein [Fibrobacter sp. UWR2]|uniref:GtrA family protein n=1 Tax=Fibrobacter sp. UWR2 TaxID=1964352 RepID=UPI000B5245CD|nr:GtrA family protein [Fibrobacter sp. UWR2]OWV02399.1 polysaccharide synthesis protein GtrA [Fibrobacter sp. UWR2]
MLHFIKYNAIGIVNTLITLVVSWVLLHLLDWSLEVSNFLGFVAGGINSYLMNRIWNFKSENRKRTEVVRFIVVFLLSYALNFVALEACVYVLDHVDCLQPFCTWVSQFMKPSYVANIVANVVYVLASYTLYKKWVFRK